MVSPHRPDLSHGRVELAHGAGGRASHRLIAAVFQRHFTHPALLAGDDGAVLDLPASSGRLVTSCDGHVVSPLFFAGGDIGCLAVHGTVNDVAMMGAKPLWLTAGFIIEEGFALADLERIAASMAKAAAEAGVAIVSGDTKVVERGKADGVFITTTGIGWLEAGPQPSGRRAEVGDAILLSGTLGEHGLAIMAERQHLGFETSIRSDTAALNGLVAAMVSTQIDLHVLRDPTRGGLAALLNEVAHQSGVGMVIDETALPIRNEVAAACELLGLDPLNLACEGRLVAMVAAADRDALLAVMRTHPLASDARVIGEVVDDANGFVEMRTTLGGVRMVDWLSGDPLPRIC